MQKADDAGVYKISDELAIIHTVDFFTPIVDDPYFFGQIAAANALSDVYAMGGEPKTAMNLAAFPIKTMDVAELRRIIEGGLDKMREADVVLVGGHTIEDNELKYGLPVSGFVHPAKLWSKHQLKPDDRLILTKRDGATRKWYRHDLKDGVFFSLSDPEYYRENANFVNSLMKNRQCDLSFNSASMVDCVIDQVRGLGIN